MTEAGDGHHREKINPFWECGLKTPGLTDRRARQNTKWNHQSHQPQARDGSEDTKNIMVKGHRRGDTQPAWQQGDIEEGRFDKRKFHDKINRIEEIYEQIRGKIGYRKIAAV